MNGTLRIGAVRLSGGDAPQRSVMRAKHGIEYRTYNMRVDLRVDGGEEFSLGLASAVSPPAEPATSAAPAADRVAG